MQKMGLYVLQSHTLFCFFQAEDGIRDIGVTGVQTCALPISSGLNVLPERVFQGADMGLARVAMRAVAPLIERLSRSVVGRTALLAPLKARAWSRSEERRVGKECRSRWSPYQ